MHVYTKFDPANPPSPLMTSKSGSFAYRAMTTRKPMVIRNILKDYEDRYPTGFKLALQALHDELVEDKVIQPLKTRAPDGPDWTQAWQPYQNNTWLDCPWYFAEAFFYRRILEAVDYFGQGKWAGVDPYLPRKKGELNSDAPWQILTAALAGSIANSTDSLQRLLHHCLWGNRVDLSYTKITEDVGRGVDLAGEEENLLVNNTEAVLTHLQDIRAAGHTDPRIDFICDNAGTELLMDLTLADFLLRFKWAAQIVLHVKAHPTYVSDTTEPDVGMTIDTMRTKQPSSLLVMADRLAEHSEENRLQIRPNIFWNSSHFFWEIPSALQRQLARSQLLIFKGDVNYRRLVGDSRWPATVPIGDVVPYLPTPFVALRTMKSDPVVGLQPGQAEAFDEEDPDWRVNGKRGMIQAHLNS